MVHNKSTQKCTEIHWQREAVSILFLRIRFALRFAVRFADLESDFFNRFQPISTDSHKTYDLQTVEHWICTHQRLFGSQFDALQSVLISNKLFQTNYFCVCLKNWLKFCLPLVRLLGGRSSAVKIVVAFWKIDSLIDSLAKDAYA